MLKAEIVNDIKINGNSRISNETIKIYGEIELGKDLSENDLDKFLKIYLTLIFLKMLILNLKKIH